MQSGSGRLDCLPGRTARFFRPPTPASVVPRVTIEYCVSCGFRDRALDLQRAILTSLERRLDAAELVMGDHGVFRVAVDGETVYDAADDDADIDEIVRTVRANL
jgi:selenoprotein W-related protein